MRNILLALCFMPACYLADPLDGEIENPSACCLHWPSEDAIQECADRTYPPATSDAEGENGCWRLECSVPGHEIVVYTEPCAALGVP